MRFENNEIMDADIEVMAESENTEQSCEKLTKHIVLLRICLAAVAVLAAGSLALIFIITQMRLGAYIPARLVPVNVTSIEGEEDKLLLSETGGALFWIVDKAQYPDVEAGYIIEVPISDGDNELLTVESYSLSDSEYVLNSVGESVMELTSAFAKPVSFSEYSSLLSSISSTIVALYVFLIAIMSAGTVVATLQFRAMRQRRK